MLQRARSSEELGLHAEGRRGREGPDLGPGGGVTLVGFKRGQSVLRVIGFRQVLWLHGNKGLWELRLAAWTTVQGGGAGV